MAGQNKKNYASGFNNLSDGETYYYRDDDARSEIDLLKAENTQLKERLNNIESFLNGKTFVTN